MRSASTMFIQYSYSNTASYNWVRKKHNHGKMLQTWINPDPFFCGSLPSVNLRILHWNVFCHYRLFTTFAGNSAFELDLRNKLQKRPSANQSFKLLQEKTNPCLWNPLQWIYFLSLHININYKHEMYLLKVWYTIIYIKASTGSMHNM